MPRRSARIAKQRGHKRKRNTFEEHQSEEEYQPESSSSDSEDATDTLSEDLNALDQYKYPTSSDEPTVEPPRKKRKVRKLDNNTKKHKRGPNKYSNETGGGFSTKQKALQTVRFIQGRDVRYQVNMISSFLCGARSILKKAKTQEKAKNIEEAIVIFEKWMNEYEANKHNIENFDHLTLDIIKKYGTLVDLYNRQERKNEEMEYAGGMEIFDIEKTYLNVFERLDGEIRALRVTEAEQEDDDGVTWDIFRNKKLLEFKQELIRYDIRCDGRMKSIADCLLYYKRGKLKGLPSRLHLQMIMYGYSPNKSVIGKLAKNVKSMVRDIQKTYQNA
eukprot:14901_1